MEFAALKLIKNDGVLPHLQCLRRKRHGRGHYLVIRGCSLSLPSD